jgi:hypothetical protein
LLSESQIFTDLTDGTEGFLPAGQKIFSVISAESVEIRGSDNKIAENSKKNKLC